MFLFVFFKLHTVCQQNYVSCELVLNAQMCTVVFYFHFSMQAKYLDRKWHEDRAGGGQGFGSSSGAPAAAASTGAGGGGFGAFDNNNNNNNSFNNAPAGNSGAKAVRKSVSSL